jgi:carboxymethylenebutenolidase
MSPMIELDGGLHAYRSDPPDSLATKGGIIVIHEIWGLVPQIEGIADRLAAEGYIAIAPDILSGIGISSEVGLELKELMTSADEPTRTAAQPLLRDKMAPARAPEFAAWAVGELRTVVDYLTVQSGVDGRIAVTGFCFGGGFAFALAAADPRVRAAIPFYGWAPEGTVLAGISCPVLAFYGSEDTGLMSALPELTANLKNAGVDFTSQVYEGAGHAFFNETTSRAYRPDAAADAWQRALAFLDASLQGGH